MMMNRVCVVQVQAAMATVSYKHISVGVWTGLKLPVCKMHVRLCSAQFPFLVVVAIPVTVHAS
jgi:hypothetical protein